MHVLDNRFHNNSVKNCARYLIFVPKFQAECPLEHYTQNLMLIFPMQGPFRDVAKDIICSPRAEVKY